MASVNIGTLRLNLEKHLENQAHNLAREVAHKVYRASQAIVPIDTGELEESCRADYISNGHFRVMYDCDHAIYAHEQPQSSRKNGKSQFLALALDDVRDELSGIITTSSGGGEL